MSLTHAGNAQPTIDREEHKHLGDNEEQVGAKGVISVDDYAQKIVEVGLITYICKAHPGASLSDTAWQCKKIDQSTSGTTLVTYADGNRNFDNVATDPTSLTYS